MSNYIIIPDRFQRKLNIEKNWEASSTSLITNLYNYFSLSPKFFPDYTIHGIAHINNVLKMADWLVPNNTLEKLSSRDIAVLISAIAIHDIGMFITEDGLFKLIFTENKNDKMQNIDDHSWEEEWGNYVKKISRYNDQQLIDTFGDASPICAPSKEINTMQRKDYLIYGEFLRRQHHRIAHHIASKGFPGTTNRDIFQNCGDLADQRDIIGLIARSHGMNIRDTENYIRINYGDDTMPNGIPIFYLMVVLRLSDYLDAGKHRAPFELEDRQEISISISKKEWKWNQCINIENYSLRAKKDKLIVQATPKTTLDFVKIEQWLKQVQYEFDISWAILAEKYDAGNLNLSVHRITSNLLNEETRNEMSKSFLTREAKLIANPNLLKLLIRPLYGEDPSFGVREMIQNSVDACIERQHIEKKRENLNYLPKIVVSIDKKNKIFKIVDNGIGMNEEVLLNYYLSAGSSYRESDDWIKDYTIDNKAQIARTGKFGVGVLSSFLLGESIHVKTRWIDDDIGYDFVFTMEQNSININRSTLDIGTTIEIELSDKTVQSLRPHNYWERNVIDWTDWYAFKYPLLEYYVDDTKLKRHTPYIPQEKITKGWFNYKSPKFESFIWQYSRNASFYCNGIGIPNYENDYIGQDFGWSMEVPSISLIDKLGNLRLNLSRSTILEFPDECGFIRETYKYFIAKLLISNKSAKDNTFLGFSLPFLYKETYRRYLRYGHPESYLFTENGFSVLCEPFLVSLNIERLILVCLSDDTKLNKLQNLQINVPIVFLHTSTVRASIEAYRNVIDPRRLFSSFEDKNYSKNIILSRFWGEIESFNDVKDKVQKGFFNATEEHKTITSFCRYDKKNLKSNVPFIEEQLDPEIYSIIAEYEIKIKNMLKNNIMLDVIKEYLGEDIWIPYNFEERKKKFPKAFDELKVYMDT